MRLAGPHPTGLAPAWGLRLLLHSCLLLLRAPTSVWARMLASASVYAHVCKACCQCCLQKSKPSDEVENSMEAGSATRAALAEHIACPVHTHS